MRVSIGDPGAQYHGVCILEKIVNHRTNLQIHMDAEALF